VCLPRQLTAVHRPLAGWGGSLTLYKRDWRCMSKGELVSVFQNSHESNKITSSSMRGFFLCCTLLIVPTAVFFVFTARRYASAVYVMALCPSVRPSVCHKPVYCTKMAIITLSYLELEGHFCCLKPFQFPYLGKYRCNNYDMFTQKSESVRDFWLVS